MQWWLVGAVILLAIVVLAVAIRSLIEHLRPLRRAIRRLRIRAEQAARLQAKLAVTQERALALQQSLDQAAARTGKGH